MKKTVLLVILALCVQSAALTGIQPLNGKTGSFPASIHSTYFRIFSTSSLPLQRVQDLVSAQYPLYPAVAPAGGGSSVASTDRAPSILPGKGAGSVAEGNNCRPGSTVPLIGIPAGLFDGDRAHPPPGAGVVAFLLTLMYLVVLAESNLPWGTVRLRRE